MLCSASELVGVALLCLTSINPMVAAVFIGIGAGGLFPLTLLLPIDATATAAEASSWSAMAQSLGYIIGASGPLIVGAMHDVTKNFAMSFGLLFAIMIAMLIMELFVVGKAKAD